MIITKNTPVTYMDIWAPKYSTKHTEKKEWCLLLAQYKVDMAAPVIIVTITKAKHMLGMKLCITRSEAQTSPVVDNSKIPCYEVMLSKFRPYETSEDVKRSVEEIGW